MFCCTCSPLLNTDVWIIYPATIQLGASLVFTFYRQGRRVSPRRNLNTWHILVPRPLVQSVATTRARKIILGSLYICMDYVHAYLCEYVCVCVYIHTQIQPTYTMYTIYLPICVSGERPGGRQQQLTLHNSTSVYTRQLCFLPTIMREIESQEMFVFLSIRPNNNIIPPQVYKSICHQKDVSTKNDSEPADVARQVRAIGP